MLTADCHVTTAPKAMEHAPLMASSHSAGRNCLVADWLSDVRADQFKRPGDKCPGRHHWDEPEADRPREEQRQQAH